MVSTPGRAHRVLSKPVGTVILTVLVMLGTFGIVATGVGFVYSNHQRCLDQQRGWDNREDAWLILTEPVVYPTPVSSDLRALEKAANARRRVHRHQLLVGLCARPAC